LVDRSGWAESRNFRFSRTFDSGRVRNPHRRYLMNGIIYLVGLVVVVGIILSFFGLR
jgi:hypothetical protein